MYDCIECHKPIPAGHAVLRGNTEVVNAYHRICHELRGIETATLVATVEGHVGPGSLALRLAMISS